MCSSDLDGDPALPGINAFVNYIKFLTPVGITLRWALFVWVFSGPPPKSRGYFFTRHSQTTFDPDCPGGSTKLWSGFSLLHLTGDGKARGQDLGEWGALAISLNSRLEEHEP